MMIITAKLHSCAKSLSVMAGKVQTTTTICVLMLVVAAGEITPRPRKNSSETSRLI